MARYEKTGVRDLGLIRLHIMAGIHCRAGGVQFLVLEYHRGQPVALIDYRKFSDGWPELDHPIYLALNKLAGDLPFLLAFSDEAWGYHVHPINHPSRVMLGAARNKSEVEFVDWLHDIRGNPERLAVHPELGTETPAGPPTRAMGVRSLLELRGAEWPGQETSGRHRRYGRNCPIVDVDMMIIDNNDGVPLAHLEFKKGSVEVDWNDTNITAPKKFAERRNLPFMVVRYESPQRNPGWFFRIEHPQMSKDAPWYTEVEWFDYLRSFRVKNIVAT